MDKPIKPTIPQASILALIALGSLAGIVGFAIGAGVVYWSYKSFVRAILCLPPFDLILLS
jgi:hypothetical protein